VNRLLRSRALTGGARRCLRTLQPIAAAAFLVWVVLLTLPIGNTFWRQTLGVAGEVAVGAPRAMAPAPTFAATLTPFMPYAGIELGIRLGVEVYSGTDQPAVYNEVCVSNQGSFPTQELAIVAAIQAQTGPGAWSDTAAASIDTSSRSVLQPGETGCYVGQIAFSSIAGAQYRSRVSVAIQNYAGWMPGSPNCPGQEPCSHAEETFAEIWLEADAPAQTATPAPTQYAPTPTAFIEATPNPTPSLWPTPTAFPTLLTLTLTLTPTPPGTPPPDTVSPTPTLPVETPIPTLPAPPIEAPSPTPTASETPQPTGSEAPTETPESPTATPQPTNTPASAATTEAPSPTPTASETPHPSPSEMPTETPEPPTVTTQPPNTPTPTAV